MQHNRGAGVIAGRSLIGNVEKENEQGAVSCRSDGDKWTVKTETRAVGRYTDRVRAIAAAIDLANAAATAGRCAEVTETEGPILQTIWSFGKDLFPSSLASRKTPAPAAPIECHKLSY